LAVGLTIGLSVVSRSVTDIRISQEQEESARAFSAAEAGIEAKLSGQDISSYGGFTVNVESKGLVMANSFLFPDPVKKGETQTVWLVGHNAAGDLDPSVHFSGDSLTIYWGNEGTSDNEDETPALEATLIFQSGGDFKTRKFTADPYFGRPGDNHFGTAEKSGYTFQGQTLAFKTVLSDLPSDPDILYALRLKLLYNEGATHLLGVEASGGDLPEQGQCYESTASQTTTGISSKVKQCNLYKTPPLLFDYVIFSEENLEQQ
jgi:hypothetical protein